jgi:hypothetical protein
VGSRIITAADRARELECPNSLFRDSHGDCPALASLRERLRVSLVQTRADASTIAALRAALDRLGWARTPARSRLAAAIATDRIVSKLITDVQTVKKPTLEQLEELKRSNPPCPPLKTIRK